MTSIASFYSKYRKLLLTASIAVLLPLGLLAQKKITIQDIVDKKFNSKGLQSIRWFKNGAFYSALEDNKIIKYNIKNGKAVKTLFHDTNIKIQDYSFSSDESQILILTERKKIYRHSYTAFFYIYNIYNQTLIPLSHTDKQSYATFSPDGTKIAFGMNNNLFYKDLKTNKEYAITQDGKFNSIINGHTDWVYEEEFAFTKAFFWSPNGDQIAYYVFDESLVKEYNMQVWNDSSAYPEDYRFKYPKAGEKNAEITIKIYNINTKEKHTIDLGEEKDIYIPSIQWTADNTILAIRKLNRLQNELTLYHFNTQNHKLKIALKEKSSTYIDFNFCKTLIYLNDKKHFISTSEKSGYKHFYLYKINEKQAHQVRQITKGNWEVDAFVRFDTLKSLLYYTSTEASHLERHFYSINIQSRKKKLLSRQKGTHKIDMSPDCQYYIDHFSSALNIPQVRLYKTNSKKPIKILENNKVLEDELDNYNLKNKQFFTFQTEDKLLLNGLMILPPDFDAQKKYPVLIHVYGGPGSQLVRDNWAGRHYYWHQFLSQKGYIVVIADNRGTGARGAVFKKSTYLKLGEHEVKDQIDLVKHLTNQTYIDKDRVGIWGWSYGGYMSSLLITLCADFYKLGIAVAPVSHWRFYDTIYTERYLRKPKDNKKGYTNFSPLMHADQLKGKYFLIHGTGDDNVHFQNAIAMQNELIKADKQFESFYYPNRNHSMTNYPSLSHLYQMMTDFIVKNL